MELEHENAVALLAPAALLSFVSVHILTKLSRQITRRATGPQDEKQEHDNAD